MAVAELSLDLPWVAKTPEQVHGVTVRRGQDSKLLYEDGISLEVKVIDPAEHEGLETLIDEVAASTGPGRVVLVAGDVPLDWRSRMRLEEISFLDVSGVLELWWPRLRVSARRLGQAVQRRTAPLPLQKTHALVVQELLVAAAADLTPSITELAEGAGVSLSSASRVASQLEAHGFVRKHDEGSLTRVSLVDFVELADHLAERTAWARGEVLWGYLWGRNSWEVADRLTSAADTAEAPVAITGRAAASFLGIIGTADVPVVSCWIGVSPDRLVETAESLDLDPAPQAEANVGLRADRWRVGLHRCARTNFDSWEAAIAHPVRVWADLHGERRGSEFAAQLWGMIRRGR